MGHALRDVEHLVRLALLFLGGVILFLVARALLVPEGFGELGHFRSGSLIDNRQVALRYAGRAACAECHDDVAVRLATDSHAQVGCEACHGALLAHATDPDNAKAPELDQLDLCARCHAANPARPQTQPQVDIEPHREGSLCSECHQSHEPAS
jgi:hypothetical protein